MSLPVPTEDIEQRQVVHWLHLKGYRHFHVPNSTYTTSFKQKLKNKLLGVSAGVPDLFIIVSGQLIAIEMKRVKGGTISPEQKAWIEALNDGGVPAKVCRGAEDAISFVQQWEQSTNHKEAF